MKTATEKHIDLINRMLDFVKDEGHANTLIAKRRELRISMMHDKGTSIYERIEKLKQP